MKKVKQGFVMRYQWLAKAKRLMERKGSDVALRLLLAIGEYAENGVEPSFGCEALNDAFEDLRIAECINEDNERYSATCAARVEAGRKGGFAKSAKNQMLPNDTKCYQNVANVADIDRDIDIDIDIDKDIYRESNNVANAPRSTKPTKHKFGKYGNVLLTEQEVNKLKSEFPTDYQYRIDNLSAYMASTGKRYKSHYVTILRWAEKDNQSNNGNNNSTSFSQDAISAIVAAGNALAAAGN